MSAPTQSSPFAALTLKEQQEKWIVWQSQHIDSPAFSAKEASLPPLQLPSRRTSQATPPSETAPAPSAPAPEPPLPPVRHSQYDAVLKRMDLAGRRAGPWQSVT